MGKQKENFSNEPLWYKDAVIYELHVKAFSDSNGDGIGDFRGLTAKLDYLQNLGINTLWLLPFYPSPLKDDGYDISDYFNIHPDYGSLADFKRFLDAAHTRGIRVIIELVINHTSSEHKWFKQAQKAKPGSNTRNFYVWSDTPEKYRDARIIFQDFETSNWTWDPEAQSHYWHRFYSHQPDLNFKNPNVQKAIFRIADHWFGLGVDGVRLDAVPYLFEREGTNCENLPETHEFLKKLRHHVDKKFKNRMLLAEANQWPEDAATYFGEGDECHMAFHFPLMPRLFIGIQMEDNFPIMDVLRSTPQIPHDCQWAIFLRNHDELTLEMVSDEERDYMYNTFAQEPRMKINLGIRRRLAPLLEKDRKKIELMNILLMSLPGTPVLYYGDEIGMGDNYYLGDRDGVRTPMQWSADKNAGFSNANPQQLYLPVITDPLFHHTSINVENQQDGLSSLLWWMRRLINMRKQHRAFSRGSLEFITNNNPRVLSFIRQYKTESILVVASLSRLCQTVMLRFQSHFNYIPRELFSGNEFPAIKRKPYVMTLTPFAFFWLVLENKSDTPETVEYSQRPTIRHTGPVTGLFTGPERGKFIDEVLPDYLQSCRWFRSKSRTITRVSITEDIPVGNQSIFCHILIVEVYFSTGPKEIYHLPVSLYSDPIASRIKEEHPHTVIAYLDRSESLDILFDASADRYFRTRLTGLTARAGRIKGGKWSLLGKPGKNMKKAISQSAVLESYLLHADQSNTSIRFGDSMFLKLYRKLDSGANPESEILQHLSESTSFRNIPAFMGNLEIKNAKSEVATVGILMKFIENAGDGWSYFLDMSRQYLERILSREKVFRNSPPQTDRIVPITPEEIPEQFSELLDSYFFELLTVLGARTAEMHLALGANASNPVFAPEKISLLYQRSLYQSMQAQVKKTFIMLREKLSKLTEETARAAVQLLSEESVILTKLKALTETKLSGKKIRLHGDYHLGQVLRSANDFYILDFEGEPARSLGERKLKYPVFKDLAGMVRSFHYAIFGAKFLDAHYANQIKDQSLEIWTKPWYHVTSGLFLSGYYNTMNNSPLLPSSIQERELLLGVFLLEKSVYEISYEINNRPEWAIIPISSLLESI